MLTGSAAGSPRGCRGHGWLGRGDRGGWPRAQRGQHVAQGALGRSHRQRAGERGRAPLPPPPQEPGQQTRVAQPQGILHAHMRLCWHKKSL